ncbi:MAG TPA: DUF1858 domain-containing protein [Lachnospiraceae bacterium]|nr:DUF1858 domain-containing protein [Lachnospiraceae bacterium]
MDNIINLSKTVYEIYNENPEIMKILQDLGFQDIGKPGMMNTVGRFMTIPKGAAMKKISMEQIKKTLLEKGYVIRES